MRNLLGEVREPRGEVGRYGSHVGRYGSHVGRYGSHVGRYGSHVGRWGGTGATWGGAGATWGGAGATWGGEPRGEVRSHVGRVKVVAILRGRFLAGLLQLVGWLFSQLIRLGMNRGPKTQLYFAHFSVGTAIPVSCCLQVW